MKTAFHAPIVLASLVAAALWAGCSVQKTQPFKTFALTDPVAGTNLVVDGDAWRADCRGVETLRLFELANPGLEGCTVLYRAKLKSEGLTGPACLEMLCRFPGKGEFFSRGLDQTVTGTKSWTACQAPFFLKAGEKPDLLKLNVMVQGAGKVWVKDVEVVFLPGPGGK